jgi:hypothetical protein
MTELSRDEDEALCFWDEWAAEEVPFLQEDEPWQRAHFIVGTASWLPHHAETEVVVSPPLTQPTNCGTAHVELTTADNLAGPTALKVRIGTW